MVDGVRHMLGDIQAIEQDGVNDYAELVEPLKLLQTNPAAEPASAV